MVFQAGTQFQADLTLAQGGRVLGVTGLGADLAAALATAYSAIAAIHFDHMYYRRDIGHRVLDP